MTSNRSDSEREHRVVREVREEALRFVRVLGERGFAIDAAVLAPEEPAARFERRRDRTQSRGDVRTRHVEEAVHREDGVEGPAPVEGEEVGRLGDEALGAARLDHGRRRVGAHHIQTGIREELAVLTRPAPISSSRVAPAASSRARNASRSSCFQFSTGCRSRTSTLASYACRNRASTDSYVSPIRSVLPAPGTGLPGETSDDFCSCPESKG